MDDDLQDFYEYLEYLDYLEEREEEEVQQQRLPRRYIRDVENPIERYGDREFQCRYRFLKSTVVEILFPFVRDLFVRDERGLPISPMMRLLTALRFYATGLYQRDNGHVHGLSQSTVCKIIKEVSVILANNVRNYVLLPKTPQKQQEVKRKFYALQQFPGVVGCIDGTHIKISSPRGDMAEVFRNRKHFFSLKVQVLAGPDMQIQDITARYPGSYHDADIFQYSGLGISLERGDIRGVILGDSSYPCEPYLLTPVLNPTTPAERRYNEAHKGTQNVVKRAIGIWKQRFRCLSGELKLKVENTAAVICATCVLHNIARANNDPLPEEEIENYDNSDDDLPFMENEGPGLIVRRDFIDRHFS